MSSPFQLAMSAGLAVALVSAYFARREGQSWRRVALTFAGWMAAFLLAGVLSTSVGNWLVVHVF
ncbi:MAG: hypothetical protein ABEJ28_10080 [Salinigranum sp.]